LTTETEEASLKNRLARVVAVVALVLAIAAVPVAGAATITDAIQPDTVDTGTGFCSPQQWSGWHSFDLTVHGVTVPARVTSVRLPFQGYATLRLYADPDSVFPGSVPTPADGPNLLWAGQIHNDDMFGGLVTVPVDATVRTGERVVVHVASNSGEDMGLGVSLAGDNNSSYVTGCNGSYPNPFGLWIGGFPWTITTGPADLTPPLITVPSFVDVPATSATGTAVDFAATATDDVDGPLTYGNGPGHFVCHPDPGSTFAIGDTVVNCFAVDSSSNLGTASFVIHVQGVDEQLVQLIATVDSYKLAQLGSSLHDKLSSVQKFRTAGKTSQACVSLASFLNQVRSQTGKGLTSAQGADLSASAQRISGVMGC
jgi:hypothetical protein